MIQRNTHRLAGAGHSKSFLLLTVSLSSSAAIAHPGHAGELEINFGMVLLVVALASAVLVYTHRKFSTHRIISGGRNVLSYPHANSRH